MINASNSNFSLAKQQMLHGLEKFASFSNDMDRKFPVYGFEPFNQKLAIHANAYSTLLFSQI